jgi:hypothetical protein
MKLTVESERILVVLHQKGTGSWCPVCGAGVTMVGIEEAVAIADVSPGAIYRQIEQRRLHFSESTPGELLICLNSLLKQKRIGD